MAVVLAMLAGAIVAPSVAADWPTYHGDNTRAGNDPADQRLGNAVPAWTSPHLDGAVYGQPVLVGRQVVVATENDTVYALDGLSGQVSWSTHVGTPRTSGFPCGNINPLGITGTPVVDQGSVFVLAEIQRSSSAFEFDLVTLRLSDGAVTRQVDVNPGSSNGINFNPNYQQQRGALTLSAGVVYMTFGGLSGDCTNPNNATDGYRGYVVAYPETGSGTVQWWSSASLRATDMEAGIWSPGGASVDAQGNVFVSTGNSNESSASDPYDFSDGVVKLAPGSPTVVDYFAPSGLVDATHDGGPTWYQDNAADSDLGSVTPVQLPNNRVFVVGKSGMGYLLDATNLGHVSGGLASHRVCAATSDAAFGSLAAASVNGVTTVFVGCRGGMQAVNISSTGSNFSKGWYNTAGVANKPPIVAGGEVWGVSSSGGSLLGFDQSNGALVHSFGLIGSNHFTSPSAANNLLAVAQGSQVEAFVGAGIGAPPMQASAFVLDTVSRLDGFLRGSDRQPYEDEQAPAGGVGSWGTWSPSASPPTSIISSITAAANADGHLELMAQGSDTLMYHSYQRSDGTLSPWAALWSNPLPAGLAPGVTLDSTGALEVFVRSSTDSTLYVARETAANSSTSWTGLRQVTANPSASDPVVVQRSDGNLELFARSTTDSTLYDAIENVAGGWSQLNHLGAGAAASKPVALRDAGGGVDVVIRGTDGFAYTKRQSSSSGWSIWTGLGPYSFLGTPVAAVTGGGGLDVYIVGNDNQLYRQSQSGPGGGWPGYYTGMGGALRGDLSAANRYDGSPEVLAFGTSGALYHADWIPTAEGWTALEPVDGSHGWPVQ